MFRDLYSSHPSFYRKYAELQYPEEAANELQKIYGCLSFGQTVLTKRSLHLLEHRSEELLSRVFESWIDNAEDDRQRDFLQDCYKEASFLIKEDFSKAYLQSKRQKQHSLSSDELHRLTSLCNDGYWFGAISEGRALRMKAMASVLVNGFLENETRNRVRRTDLSTNTGPIIKQLARHLNQLFETDGTNKIMSAYLGYEVCVGALALEMGSGKSSWWHSIYEDSPDTLYIHRDETTSLPKAFIYLDNIEKSDGAFSVFPEADSIHGKPSWLQSLIGRRIGCIGRSERHHCFGRFKHAYHQPFGDPQFRSLFLSLPPEVRYSSHYGWDLRSSDSIHDELLKCELTLEGPAGTLVIFDGSRLSHRALQEATNKHLSLQAVFCPRRDPLEKLGLKVSKFLSGH